MGLEPTNGGTTIHCLNLLATLAIAFFTIAPRLFLDLVFHLRQGKKQLKTLMVVAFYPLKVKKIASY
jgi:hypothetical protein